MSDRKWAGRIAAAVFVALTLGLSCGSALAQVDCDKLRTTKVPYQVTFDVAPGVSALPDTAQVFRQPGSMEVTYKFTASSPSFVVKQLGQYGILTKLNSLPPYDKINIDYSYDADLANISFFTKKDLTYRMTAKGADRQSYQDVKVTFLKEDTMVVGACALHTFNYHFDITPDDTVHHSATIIDIVWSPDLEFTLALKGVRGDAPTPTPYFFAAKAITTDFKQISDR